MANIDFVPNDYVQQRESGRANLMYLVLFGALMGAIGVTFSIIKMRQASVDKEFDIVSARMLQAQGQANAAAGVTWDSTKSALTPFWQPPNGVDAVSTPLDSVQETQYIGIKEGPRGADVTDLAQEILDTYDDIEAVWAMYTDVEPVITSGRDSHENVPTSLHNFGKAIDVRANNISDEISQKIADTLQARLGYKYDVDFEHFPEKPQRDHVHIEYDLK